MGNSTNILPQIELNQVAKNFKNSMAGSLGKTVLCSYVGNNFNKREHKRKEDTIQYTETLTCYLFLHIQFLSFALCHFVRPSQFPVVTHSPPLCPCTVLFLVCCPKTFSGPHTRPPLKKILEVFRSGLQYTTLQLKGFFFHLKLWISFFIFMHFLLIPWLEKWQECAWVGRRERFVQFRIRVGKQCAENDYITAVSQTQAKAGTDYTNNLSFDQTAYLQHMSTAAEKPTPLLEV